MYYCMVILKIDEKYFFTIDSVINYNDYNYIYILNISILDLFFKFIK